MLFVYIVQISRVGERVQFNSIITCLVVNNVLVYKCIACCHKLKFWLGVIGSAITSYISIYNNYHQQLQNVLNTIFMRLPAVINSLSMVFLYYPPFCVLLASVYSSLWIELSECKIETSSH